MVPAQGSRAVGSVLVRAVVRDPKLAPDMNDRTPEQRRNCQELPPWAASRSSFRDDKVDGRTLDGVHHALPCGCKVTGDGSLPFPLTVIPCDHARLREALKAIEWGMGGCGPGYCVGCGQTSSPHSTDCPIGKALA